MTEQSPLLAHAEAQAHIMSGASRLSTEMLATEAALGRVLSRDLMATRDSPPWDNSAMDGYAIRTADLGSLPCALTVVESIFAGRRPTRTLGPGECAREAPRTAAMPGDPIAACRAPGRRTPQGRCS